MNQTFKIKRNDTKGFTLVEMLVSLAVLALMLVMLTKVLDSAQKVWSGAVSSTQQFREARVAFEAMNRRISQAILNTYWDYDKPNAPSYYIRNSDLHFICGPRDGILTTNVTSPTKAGNKDGNTDAIFFIAPLGYTTTGDPMAGVNQLNSLLNAWGYYIAYGSDLSDRPPFLQQDTTIIPEKKRFRLYEFRQPSESLQIYQDNYLPKYNGYVTSDGTNQVTMQQVGNATPAAARAWYQNILGTDGKDTSLIPQNGSVFADGSQARVIADNIIALLISPRNPGIYINNQSYPDFYYAPDYYYDSRCYLIKGLPLTSAKIGTYPQIINTGNILPPVVQVTMVALDEASAARYALLYPSDAPPVLKASTTGTGLFQQISSQDAAFGSTDDQYQTDLVTFENWLTSQHLNYEVFKTSIPIRAAKFSAPQ